MKKKWFVYIVITLVLILVTGQVVLAQDGGPGVEDENASQGTIASASSADVGTYFPVQGRVTNAAGIPLDGIYSMTFRLYDIVSGGVALCSDTNSVQVTKGLFSTEVWGNCQDDITGQQLYLSIQVESDPEMSPRQPIYPVPYAWSLRPGSVISGLGTLGAVLHTENTGDGAGLYSSSESGAAIVAGGTGIIKSSAQSSIWISGNGVRPYRATDTTVINLDTIGGAKISPGTTVGNKIVMLPITIPGPLYGQNVKVVDMDVYFQGNTEFDVISNVLLRRQTGVCSACYVNIINDAVDHVCDVANNSTGCVLHYDLTTNNTLTSASGILYLTIEMGFGGSGNWVDLGGVRLNLEHD